MAISVIKLKLSEAARLRVIRLQALKDAPYAFGADFQKESEKDLSYWQDNLNNTNWCIAVDNGRDIGLLAVDLADADRGSDCWLSSWWIDQNYRGQGVSKLMLQWLDQLCVEKGWHKQGLGVWPENEAAIDVYLKLGFTKGDKELQSRSRPEKMYLPMYRNLPL